MQTWFDAQLDQKILDGIYWIVFNILLGDWSQCKKLSEVKPLLTDADAVMAS